MINKKDIEAEFGSKLKDWVTKALITGDEKDAHDALMAVKEYTTSLPLSLLESLEKDVEVRKCRCVHDCDAKDVLNIVLSLIKQYKEQLK